MIKQAVHAARKAVGFDIGRLAALEVMVGLSWNGKEYVGAGSTKRRKASVKRAVVGEARVGVTPRGQTYKLKTMAQGGHLTKDFYGPIKAMAKGQTLDIEDSAQGLSLTKLKHRIYSWQWGHRQQTPGLHFSVSRVNGRLTIHRDN